MRPERRTEHARRIAALRREMDERANTDQTAALLSEPPIPVEQTKYHVTLSMGSYEAWCRVSRQAAEALAAALGPYPRSDDAGEGWQSEVRWRRPFVCQCGYQGWEYWNMGRRNMLICTKCGNGRHPYRYRGGHRWTLGR